MKIFGLIFFALFVNSCSHQKRAVQSYISVDEDVREARNLSAFNLTSEDGGLKFIVSAKNVPVIIPPVNKTDHYLVSIDIGAISPVECLFYPTDIPPASALYMITQEILTSKQVGKVIERKTSLISVGEIEGQPFMMLQTSFITQEHDKFLSGNLKTVVGTKEIGNVVCVHNEVGYQKTFSQIFRELLRSFEFLKLPTVEVKFKNIVLLNFKSSPIGYIVKYVGENSLKFNSWVEKTSVLVPTQNENVTALDNLAVELSDFQGRMSYALYKSDHDGRTAYLLGLSTTDFHEYSLEGKNDVRPIKQSLKAPRGLFSQFEITRKIVKNLFHQKEKTFSLPVFVPDQSLLSPTTLTFNLLKFNDAGALISSSDGKVSHHKVVAPDGTEEALTYKLKKMKIEGKRVHRAGDYPTY
jgi:hypothetical protein